MVGKTKPATKAEKNRFAIIAGHCGCIACLIEGYENSPAEIHHLTSGFRRLGHEATIGLCGWHHRGIPFEGLSLSTMRHQFGPAFSAGRKPFSAHYGDDQLLLELQNYVVQLYVLDPWPEQSLPREVGHEIRARWRALWAAG